LQGFDVTGAAADNAFKEGYLQIQTTQFLAEFLDTKESRSTFISLDCVAKTPIQDNSGPTREKLRQDSQDELRIDQNPPNDCFSIPNRREFLSRR